MWAGGVLGGRVKIYFICLSLLRWVFTAAHGLSPVAVSGGHSLVEVRDLLSAVASLVAEHRLKDAGSVVVAPRFQHTGSVVMAHRLSCSSACGVFPEQGSNPCPLHWQAEP